MKKLFVLGLLFVLYFSCPVLAQDEEYQSVQDFKVINNTGITIYDLYVSPADAENWEEDILGVETLEDGEEIMINFTGYDEDTCLFDVMIGDTEGNYFWLEDVDLCQIHELIFTNENRMDSVE